MKSQTILLLVLVACCGQLALGEWVPPLENIVRVPMPFCSDGEGNPTACSVRASWPIGDFISTYFVWNSFPLTRAAAVAAGYTLAGSCTSGVGELATSPNAAFDDITLRYDGAGNLAGLVLAAHNPMSVPFDARNTTGVLTWYADLYFRDPTTICSAASSSLVVDRLAFLFQGQIHEYPVDYEEFLTVGWYDTISCIPYMGVHHVWIPKSESGLNGPSPLIYLWDLGRGQLIGFEFTNLFFNLAPPFVTAFYTPPTTGPFWEVDAARNNKLFDSYSVHFYIIPYSNSNASEVSVFGLPNTISLQCFTLYEFPTGPTPYPYGFPSPTGPGAETARIPPDDRWRTYDGYLNNLGLSLPATDFPTYFGIPGGYNRLAPAEYEDSTGGIRTTGLPPPRVVSNTLFNRPGKLATNQVNDLHSYWGQMMVMDLCATTRYDYDAVFIDIPRCDPWKDPECTGTVSEPAIRSGAVPNLSVRIPTNDQTSYIDASWLYGPSGSHNVHLRTFEGGQLNFVWYPQMLGTSTPYGDNPFQRGGDVRVNKNPGLIAYHLIFRREHNRRAAMLQAANPSWSDEELFQNARLWVIAIIQSIFTREYTAALLGQPLSPYTGYDSQINPTVTSEFCHAAFRYGHSEVNTLFMRFDENFAQHPTGHMLCRDVLWSQQEVQRSGIEPVFRGLISQQQSENDLSFIEDIRNLYALGPYTGEDLPATNVLRGRECGTSTYNNARIALGLAPRTAWYEITDDNETQALLESLYGPAPGGIEILDLYVGGLAEPWEPQSNLGETFWTIFNNQLLAIRAGDRYWYENLDSVPDGVVWTQDNITEVYQRKLEDIISDNTNITADELGAGIFFLKSRQLEALIAQGAFDPVTLTSEEINVLGFHEDTSLRAVADFSSTAYNIYWRMNGDRSLITFMLKARINGWLGMGLDPIPGTMKGGDLYFTRIWDNATIVDHAVEVRDSFALDVGPPRLDIDVPDEDCGDSLYYGKGVTDRSEADPYYYGGNYFNGITTIYFTRRRAPGDSCDKPIPYNDYTTLIFAFNPNTKEMLYHGPTRAANNSINFFSGVYTILPEDETPVALLVILGICAGIGIVLCLILMLMILLKTDHFRFMAPTFCHLILVGAIVAYGSIFTLLQSPVNTASCTVYIWMTGVGFCFMFACLFAKTFRVWKLMNSKSLKAKMVSTTELLIWIGLLVLLEIIFLAIWTGVDMPTAEDKITPYDDQLRAWYCECNDGWWGAYAGIFGAYILVGVIFTVLTRNLPPEFNDSKAIGWSMYNLFLIWVISVGLGFGLEQWQSARVAVMGFSIFTALTFTILALFFPPVWRIIRAKEPKTFKSTMSLGGSSRGRSTGGSSTAATDSTNED